jgi:putative tributyrin esterase
MAVIKMNFLSQTLGMQTNVTICLPSFSFADIMKGREDVYVPGMKYQTMWLLHGGSGDDSDYVNFTNIVRYADNHKLAVVMPCDYNASYTDDPDGAKYFSYVVDELPKLCRAFFPLSDKREDNIVAGLSMGSHGAMKCAVVRPEQYCAALMMSGASYRPGVPSIVPIVNGEFVLPKEGETPKMGGGIGVKLQDPEYIKGTINDVYAVAEQNAKQGKPLPKMFFHCGDKDHALYRTQKAVNSLKEYGYDVSFTLEPGYGHEWDFWDLSLRKAITEWLPIKHEVIYP